MTTITISAVYRKGKLEPQAKLNLPENAQVELQVTPIPSEEPPLPKTLFGLFPELAALTEEDIMWAKQLWEKGSEKQLKLLEERDEK
jgi:predicted DNA-binding antitoxin AbrB/MazE fold protein